VIYLNANYIRRESDVFGWKLIFTPNERDVLFLACSRMNR